MFVLADHARHRLPVRRNASPQIRPDHGFPIALLRLRGWHSVLALRLFNVPISYDQSDPWRPQQGRAA